MSSPARRIHSILTYMDLMLGQKVSELDPDIHEEIQALRDFEKSPEPDKIARVQSLVGSFFLLQDSVPGLYKVSMDKEQEELESYLESLSGSTDLNLKKSPIIQKNLGSVFIRKGYGFPLFGHLRPKRPPKPHEAKILPGILLCYQSIECDGIGRFFATRFDKSSRMEYKALGVLVNSDARWVQLRISPLNGSANRVFAAPFPKKWELIQNGKFDLYLGKQPVKIKETLTVDPLYYQYMYFFTDDGQVTIKVRRYLEAVLGAMYGFIQKDTEKIALMFTQTMS